MIKTTYYTPEISEFHIGFQYEHYSEICGCWLKCWYDTMYDQRGEDKLDELHMIGERVKYLDQEDIESCGFIKTKEYDDGLTFQKIINDYNFLELDFNTECPQSVIIEHFYNPVLTEPNLCNSTTVFNGKIKNINEFKKILKSIMYE